MVNIFGPCSYSERKLESGILVYFEESCSLLEEIDSELEQFSLI